MSQDKGIVWLASYPKSGNTWFRIVLANLLSPSVEPVQLNQIRVGMIATSRQVIERALGFDSTLMNQFELHQMRPAVYRWYGQTATEKTYFKIHDAYSYCSNREPIVPIDGCLGVLYFIRNPLDVVLSFANHLHCTIDQSIEIMGNKSFSMLSSDKNYTGQLRQSLLSWSLHVESWTAVENMNRLIVRYEDMSLKPMVTFKQATDFLKLGASVPDIFQALEHSQIEKLQAQEQRSGFKEKPLTLQGQFFRKGLVGDWENALTPKQVSQVISAHGEMMYKHGYLDAQERPVRYKGCENENI